MNPTDGVQTINARLSGTPGALGATTALSLDSDFAASLTRTFLLKKVRYFVAVAGINDADDLAKLLFGFASGSASVSEIETALGENSAALADPKDPSNYGAFMVQQRVLHQTLSMLTQISSGGTSGSNIGLLQAEMAVGGSKGIPLTEDHGIQPFVYNIGSAALDNTGGIAIYGLYELVGVWLRD